MEQNNINNVEQTIIENTSIDNNTRTISKFKRPIGTYLVLASILISIVFYLVSMGVGMSRYHKIEYTQTDYFGTLGFWHTKVPLEWGIPGDTFSTTLNAAGIVTVIFFVISLSLLATGIFLNKKNVVNSKLTKNIHLLAIACFAVFVFAMIFALIGKMDDQFDDKNVDVISVWVNRTDSAWSKYSSAGIMAITFASLSVIWPAVHGFFTIKNFLNKKAI